MVHGRDARGAPAAARLFDAGRTCRPPPRLLRVVPRDVRRLRRAVAQALAPAHAPDGPGREHRGRAFRRGRLPPRHVGRPAPGCDVGRIRLRGGRAADPRHRMGRGVLVSPTAFHRRDARRVGRHLHGARRRDPCRPRVAGVRPAPRPGGRVERPSDLRPRAEPLPVLSGTWRGGARPDASLALVSAGSGLARLRGIPDQRRLGERRGVGLPQPSGNGAQHRRRRGVPRRHGAAP